MEISLSIIFLSGEVKADFLHHVGGVLNMPALFIHLVMGTYVQKDYPFFGNGEGENDTVGRGDGY